MGSVFPEYCRGVFVADIFSKKKRSELMSNIRSKNTKLEAEFRRLLFKKGLRGFRKHAKITGNPDIVFPRHKLAIFLDGKFWHGWNYPNGLPKTRVNFWRKKIKTNMKRDEEVNRTLKNLGWCVLRFWEHEIKSKAEECISKIKETLKAIEKIRSADIVAVDWFCGGGGMTRGLLNAGIGVINGLDSDASAERTYEENNRGCVFVKTDVRDITAAEVMNGIKLKRGQKLLFAACAPCQPFSQQNKKRNERDDERRPLMIDFSKKVAEIKPDYIFIENVPGLGGHFARDVYEQFKKVLEREKYWFDEGVVNAKYYGVPQNRRRLVLLASRHGQIRIPEETHGKGKTPLITVRDAIGNYPPIKAGESFDKLPNHVSRKLSERNLERISHTPEDGGDRKDWPEKLLLECHKSRRGYEDVYGRMKWDSPSPTLTCKCTSLSNGRFGHPEQDRAISLREAAALQTFGDEYVFYGGLDDITKQIGNAVPVKLAEIFGRQFVKFNREINKNRKTRGNI